LQEIEISGDRSVPLDHPERQRFNAMFDWMKKGGAQFPKLKLRYYTEDYRGVHAATQIEKGETILYVPLSQLLTLDMAMQSPIGSLMAARNFRQRLLSPKHSFLATLIMEEKRKPSSPFNKYIDILPKGFTNFPIFYTKEERNWLTGSPFQQQISDKIKDIQADY
jgi:histone-lysine N-methyltransferase SETD3